MLDSFGDLAIRLSRSPLGIIAFAFVFVYAIAGLLAVKANFDVVERRILLGFLLIFPVLVLSAFFRLVTTHHDKLYAPSDFANDETFVRVLEQGIQSSNSFRDLKAVTTEIQAQIDAQPLYRYTGLSESGKRIALFASKGEEFDLESFSEHTQIQDVEIEAQLEILISDYGWIARDGTTLRLTENGRAELDTFVDLVYGRFR